MSKKNSQISNDELNETLSNEQITGEPVDSNVNPDGITIDPSTEDSEKVTLVKDENVVTTDSEIPVVENPTPDAIETPVDGQNPDTTDVTKTQIKDVKPGTPVTDETPVTTDSEKPVDEQNTAPVVEKPVTPVNEVTGDTVITDNVKPSDKEPVKLNEFKRFYIRFGYSIDSRSTTTRRTLSTTEIVKQFVKAPTCFIAFETKEDLKDFETLLKIKTIKVEDKEGKLVDFPDAAKKHLIERVTELSKYWISRNSK